MSTAAGRVRAYLDTVAGHIEPGGSVDAVYDAIEGKTRDLVFADLREIVETLEALETEHAVRYRSRISGLDRTVRYVPATSTQNAIEFAHELSIRSNANLTADVEPVRRLVGDWAVIPATEGA